MQATKTTVLISGICALVLTMGVARYSFTPMIPHMQEQMGLTEGVAGWLAGWNYIGYLTGLFMVWLIKDLRLKDYFFRYGLIMAVMATAVMALNDNRLVWYVSRYFAGISTAMGFMLGTGLVLKWLIHNKQKTELGIHFAGAGLGIVAGAIVVELTARGALFDLSWRGQWFALAAFGVIMAIPAMYFMPMPKAELLDEAKSYSRENEPPASWLWLLQIAYICAGFSNTMNVTFTSLIAELQPLAGSGTIMWGLVGLAAIPAPYLWIRSTRNIGDLTSLKIAFALNIMSNLLISMSTSYAATAMSSLMFGFSFMGIVSLTLSVVGKHYGYRATQIMARLTLTYCLAQIASPIMSGMIAEATGSFRPSLYVVSGIMIVGLLCLLVLKNVERKRRRADEDETEFVVAANSGV